MVNSESCVRSADVGRVTVAEEVDGAGVRVGVIIGDALGVKKESMGEVMLTVGGVLTGPIRARVPRGRRPADLAIAWIPIISGILLLILSPNFFTVSFCMSFVSAIFS